MCNIKQFTTMPYNLHGNAICKRFNHTLLGLLQSLPKETKELLAFAHSIIGVCLECHASHKAPAVFDAWLGLAHYNDQASNNKCMWLNEQDELLMSVNR